MELIRKHANLLAGLLLTLVALTGEKYRTVRDWWVLLGNARNYGRHLAGHRAERGSWKQLRYTPNGYRYGGIVSTGAVS